MCFTQVQKIIEPKKIIWGLGVLQQNIRISDFCNKAVAIRYKPL